MTNMYSIGVNAGPWTWLGAVVVIEDKLREAATLIQASNISAVIAKVSNGEDVLQEWYVDNL